MQFIIRTGWYKNDNPFRTLAIFDRLIMLECAVNTINKAYQKINHYSNLNLIFDKESSKPKTSDMIISTEDPRPLQNYVWPYRLLFEGKKFKCRSFKLKDHLGTLQLTSILAGVTGFEVRYGMDFGCSEWELRLGRIP